VLASTVTFASLFTAGRYFIERHVIPDVVWKLIRLIGKRDTTACPEQELIVLSETVLATDIMTPSKI